MNHIRIQGIAAVFRDSDDELETDPTVLGRFDAYVYDEERFTDYLGGPNEEDALAALLLQGGFLRFEYDGCSPMLTVVTEYQSTRTLTNPELNLLVAYTMGQWSDGVGENFACDRPFDLGVSVQCQTEDPPIVSQTDTKSQG